MKSRSHIIATASARIGTLVLGLVAAGSVVAAPQNEHDLELEGAQAALRASIGKSVKLQKRVEELEKINANLAASLAAANAESADFEKRYSELRLQMEALGIEVIKKGTQGMKEKLMKAISDNTHLREQRDRLSEGLVALSDAVLAYMKDAVNANINARVAVEKALREADVALGVGKGKPVKPVKKVFQGGSVVSVKRDLGVFVIDLGSRSGVGFGMPFEIIRKDRPIGTAYVLDTREPVSALVVSSLVSDDDGVTVGDFVRLDTKADF